MREPEIEIDTSFGYPLLRMKEADGSYRWFYPKTPGDFDIREPKLIEGSPSMHFSDGFSISIFTEIGGRAIPRVLKIWK